MGFLMSESNETANWLLDFIVIVLDVIVNDIINFLNLGKFTLTNKKTSFLQLFDQVTVFVSKFHKSNFDLVTGIFVNFF